MDKRESMWDVYLRKGMSRRSFVKGCVALTSLMGLSTDKLSKVVEAAEQKPLPVVIWIHGHECTGCDESFIRSGSPYASDVILSQVALEYDHLLSAASGEPFEAHLEETIQKYKGQYILAVEGAACTKDLNDFFSREDGKYGKGIINNSKTKIILNLEDEEAVRVQNILHLSEAEAMAITHFERGNGLISTNNNNVTVEFKASELEKELITTDREELKRLLEREKQRHHLPDVS